MAALLVCGVGLCAAPGAGAEAPVASALGLVASTASEQVQAIEQTTAAPLAASQPSASQTPSTGRSPDELPAQTADTLSRAAEHSPSTPADDAPKPASASAIEGGDSNAPRKLLALAAGHSTLLQHDRGTTPPRGTTSPTQARDDAASGLAAGGARELAGAVSQAHRKIVSGATGTVAAVTAGGAEGARGSTGARPVLRLPLVEGHAQAAMQLLEATSDGLDALASEGLARTRAVVAPLLVSGLAPLTAELTPLTPLPAARTVAAEGATPALLSAEGAAPAPGGSPAEGWGSGPQWAPTQSAPTLTTSAGAVQVRGASRLERGGPKSLAVTKISLAATGAATLAGEGMDPERSQSVRRPAWPPIAERSPAPPSPGGASPSATGPGAGSSTTTFLMLAALLLLAAPAAKRRLRLACEPWRAARFLLIPERPG